MEPGTTLAAILFESLPADRPG